jgi:hypothetical protein
MSDNQTTTASSAQVQEIASLPTTHFQTYTTLEDKSGIGVVVLLKDDGDIQFFLDRQIEPTLFGPTQIIEVLMRLSSINDALNKYVNDRITEAKAAIEKENQPELALDQQPDGVSQGTDSCETGTCCGGCDAGEVASHAGQSE